MEMIDLIEAKNIAELNKRLEEIAKAVEEEINPIKVELVYVEPTDVYSIFFKKMFMIENAHNKMDFSLTINDIGSLLIVRKNGKVYDAIPAENVLEMFDDKHVKGGIAIIPMKLGREGNRDIYAYSIIRMLDVDDIPIVEVGIQNHASVVAMHIAGLKKSDDIFSIREQLLANDEFKYHVRTNALFKLTTRVDENGFYVIQR